jgi:hypothetical protein
MDCREVPYHYGTEGSDMISLIVEPTLDELVQDPMVACLMDSDGVDRDELLHLMSRIRSGRREWLRGDEAVS